MVCGSHQDCLLLEEDTLLSVREHLFADSQDLSILVGTSDEAGPDSRLRVRGVKHRGEPLWSFSSHSICDVENFVGSIG